MEQTKKKGIFYGWVNVAIGAVLMAAVMGIVYNCFGQFIKPVCEELGISRRAMSVSQVLMSASQIAVSLLWGWILKHTDLKKMMILWAVAGSAGYYCYSLGNSVWVFYFASVVAGAAMSMLCILPFTHIIDNWFVEKKGLAMGICFMGSGVGGMVFNSLLGVWLETLGWRGSFQLLAIIMAALSIPGTLLLKVRPEDMGLKAYGHEKAASAAAAVRAEETGMTLAEAKKSPKLWLTLACVAMITMAVASGTQILSPHMTDNGYSVATAANMMSLSMGALAIGKMVTGGLYDLLGTKKATMLCLVFGALCVVGILLCQYPWALVLVILGTGFGCPVTNVGYPLIIQAIFGKKDFAAIVGIISAASSIGISIVPLFNGASYDMFGDYRPAFLLWLAFILLAALIMLFLLPKDEKKGRA